MGNDGNVFIRGMGASRQIGVTVTTLSKQLADYFGVADGKGLLVNDVRADSPAAKAGLKAGDVIVEIDGKKIEKNLDLIKAVNEKKEGPVSITVIRDKNRQNFFGRAKTSLTIKTWNCRKKLLKIKLIGA